MTDLTKESVIVKYLSSLLDLNFMQSYKTVTVMLSNIQTEKRIVESKREKVYLKAENAKLIAILQTGPAVRSSISLSTGASGSVSQAATATLPPISGNPAQDYSSIPGYIAYRHLSPSSDYAQDGPFVVAGYSISRITLFLA